MEITSFSAAIGGINGSIGMMNRSAQKIADGTGDLAQETVNQIVAQDTLTANGATLRTADEMLGELMRMSDRRKAVI